VAVQTAPRTEADQDAPEPTRALPVPLGEPIRTEQEEAQRRSLRDRLARSVDAASRPPYAVVAHVRLVLAMLLSALCLLTAAGSLLLLMAWRQERTSGLLASQTERLWDVWDYLANIERYVALAAAPVAVVWFAVAALNVCRSTGRRRNPIVAALSVAVAVGGTWFVGRELVGPGLDERDWVGIVGGIALQAVFLALPLLAFERLADAAEARHRPGRVAFVMSLGFVVVLQVSGALSTIDRTTELSGWGREGALVLIAALIQILAALAFTEAGRALEEGTQHRYELRHRFGESVLTQVGL